MGDLISEHILAKRGDGQQKQNILKSGYWSIFDYLPSLQALAPRDRCKSIRHRLQDILQRRCNDFSLL